MPPPGPTEILAEYVVDLQSEQISSEVFHAAKRCLLDWVGVALGGSSHEAVGCLLAVCRRICSCPQATILGRPERTDALHAALINGLTAHVLDYDDTHLESFVHPSAPVWPAISALAEMQSLTGREALAAFVIGFEVENRIGRVLFRHHDRRGWHMSGMVGGFGAAAAAGKILGLDKDRLAQAFGVAGTYGGGLREMFGTMSKSIHPGKAAMSGLFAALLAREGFTSSKRVLEAPRGFFAVHADEKNLESITEGLGESFDILKNSVKPYSCGVVIHPTVDAVLFLRKSEGLSPERIERIESEVYPMVPDVTGKRDPKTGLDGKFSIFHCMAAALIDGECGPAQFTDARVNDPEVAALRNRTGIRVNPDFKEYEARVRITTKDGRTFEKHVPRATGTPGNPLSDEGLSAKFHSMADPLLGPERALGLEEGIWQADTKESFREILALAVPGS